MTRTVRKENLEKTSGKKKQNLVALYSSSKEKSRDKILI